jgi:hypothetical protein
MTMTMTQASEKQLAFITKLLNDKDIESSTHTVYLTAISSVITTNPDTLTKVAASKAIDILLSQPSKAHAKASTKLKPGFYSLNDKVYKVILAPQTGNTYAKVFTSDGWVYAQGAVKTLVNAPALTLEEAKKYGRIYGTCIVCSRTLTDESSISAGIGPICAKGF